MGSFTRAFGVAHAAVMRGDTSPVLGQARNQVEIRILMRLMGLVLVAIAAQFAINVVGAMACRRVADMGHNAVSRAMSSGSEHPSSSSSPFGDGGHAGHSDGKDSGHC